MEDKTTQDSFMDSLILRAEIMGEYLKEQAVKIDFIVVNDYNDPVPFFINKKGKRYGMYLDTEKTYIKQIEQTSILELTLNYENKNYFIYQIGEINYDPNQI